MLPIHFSPSVRDRTADLASQSEGESSLINLPVPVLAEPSAHADGEAQEALRVKAGVATGENLACGGQNFPIGITETLAYFTAKYGPSPRSFFL